jgi:lysozyme
MKVSGNINLLLRLLIIPASLIFILLLIIKAPVWIKSVFQSDEITAPPVSSFGILMPKGYSVHGIDVSKHQGKIDWKRVSLMNNNGIKVTFAFVKATEGISRQDDRFSFNWEQSTRNGIIRGAYHFYYPSRDAGKQADNFIKQVKLKKGDMPPVIDIEMSNGKSSAKICEGIKVFIGRLEKQYKVKPIIYTNIHFYNTYLKGNFEEYPLWIAGYFDHDRFYNEFVTPWTFWQHSEQGRVDGIRGKVDFNVYNGNLEKLKKMCF